MSDRRYTIGFLVSDVARLFRRTFESHRNAGTPTLAEARALIHIANNQQIRQVDLAALLDLRPITLCRLVDTLERKELVARVVHPSDRRAYCLTVRPKAAAQLRRISRAGDRLATRATDGIGARDVEVTLRTLAKMRENLSR